jgi:hypothetical protein
MTQNASSLPEQEGLIPLPIPVPASLAGALGYGGEARYLGRVCKLQPWEDCRDYPHRPVVGCSLLIPGS